MKKAKASIFIMGWLLFYFCAFFGCELGEDEQNLKIENLRIFAKLYGYVRYFHPSDEASEIDWDKFAIYGVKQVKNISDQFERLQILKNLFYPLAPTMKIYKRNEHTDYQYPGESIKSAANSVVAWQHKGLGTGNAQSVYWSIRLNRENKFRIHGYGFGTVMQSLDAQSFQGYEIKLTAAVKMDVHGFGNQGHLWLRIDRKDNKPGFFDNMDARPIFTSSWEKYEIKGVIDHDAHQMVFGCFLKGEGKMWIDNVKLHVRKENEKWRELDIKNDGFELGKVSATPPQWLAQTPGYIFEITDKNPFLGKKSLLIKNEYIVFRGKLFDQHSKIGELIEENLDGNLRCRIPLAVWSDGKHTLGENITYPFDRLVNNVNKINADLLTAEDEDLRLADIVITWNVFQHFYPYFEEIKINWDRVLTHFLIESFYSKNEYEFLLTLKKMLAMLKDGHGNVFHKSVQSEVNLPLKVSWIEDKIVVTLSKDRRFQKGDVIVSVDGVSAINYLKEREAYISGSPHFKRYRAMQEFGMGSKDSEVRISIQRGKNRINTVIKRINYWIFNEFDNPELKKYPGNIYYVNLKKASMEFINSIINKLAKAKGVIFDLRGYPNKNHGVLSHLIKSMDTSQEWMRIPLYIYPDQRNIIGYQKMGWNLIPQKPRIQGKVVFLIDSSAISYSESFLSFVEHYRLGELVGQPTAGTNGNVNVFFLPGGFSVSWTGMKVVKHDGSAHHLIGIRPTIPVNRTIKGVKADRDEFLEKALHIITE